ncbi:hypothetical protein K439DRAFT_1625753 [Ramaria rubella]|nr:hypothetical protein K439DRAFT_1625753 [Ramaria rubella]
MHALLAVVLASVVFVVPATALQCNSSYAWYKWATSPNNAQDPCQLVSDLYNSCAPGNVDPLQPLSYNPSGLNSYPGPNSSVQNTCTCSYVMYNLMSACGDCQVGFSAPTAWPTYKVWTQSCDAVNTGGLFPDSIPSTFVNSVPIWATFSTKDSGDPRWSYGLSHSVAVGHFLVNTKLVSTSPPMCPPHLSPGLPIGTAFAGLVVGLLIASLAILFQRRRRAHEIPPPTRYHTAPDNTPLHPLLPRSAQTQGTNFLRRILEHEHENDPRRIEPFDISAAMGPASFPPHPAVFPPMRVHTFPPTLSIAAPSRGPSRQTSFASLNPNQFSLSSPLRHSRSQSHTKPGSRPQTAASQFSSSSGVAGPSVMPLQTLTPSEPPSPLPPDRHWPDVLEDPPAYRRKT